MTALIYWLKNTILCWDEIQPDGSIMFMCSSLWNLIRRGFGW